MASAAGAITSAPPLSASFPLTRDPLSVVLSHLPTPSRLRLSRVCKQWRALALEVTTSVAIYALPATTSDLNPFIEIFPALTQLTVGFVNHATGTLSASLRIPTTLTSLRVKGSCYTPQFIQLPCPALSSIAMDDLHLTLNLAAVVSASTASLTALDLSGGLGYSEAGETFPRCPADQPHRPHQPSALYRQVRRLREPASHAATSLQHHRDAAIFWRAQGTSATFRNPPPRSHFIHIRWPPLHDLCGHDGQAIAQLSRTYLRITELRDAA